MTALSRLAIIGWRRPAKSSLNDRFRRHRTLVNTGPTAELRTFQTFAVAASTDVTGPFWAFIFHAANVMNAHRGHFAANPTVLSSDAGLLRERFSRLLLLLLVLGLFLCLVMALVTHGILARINEGFAVFG